MGKYYQGGGVNPLNDLSKEITEGVRKARQSSGPSASKLCDAYREAKKDNPLLVFGDFKKDYMKSYWKDRKKKTKESRKGSRKKIRKP